MLRLYNFEKRLLVVALVLLYFSFLIFLYIAIIYFKRKNKQEKINLDDFKKWECEFEIQEIVEINEFLEKYLFNGKVFIFKFNFKNYFLKNIGKENYLLFTTKCIIGYLRGWKNEIS